MKKALFVQPNLRPAGGANAVAAWMIEALKEKDAFQERTKGPGLPRQDCQSVGGAAERSSMKRIRLLFKHTFPMAVIIMLCLFGCAVTPNDPSQRPPSLPVDTRTGVDSDVAGTNSDKGIVISPEGRSSGSMSSTPIVHEYDSSQVARVAHADDEQSAVRQGLLSVSIRATISSLDVVGDAASEEFSEYGVAANVRLPWAWYSQSGWGAGTRLLASAGVLYGAGQTALVVSLIPLVALGSQDGKFTFDMGAGGALLSSHHFGTQDFGGCFQFALTVGAGVPLFHRFGLGYRYLHYSDAGINGPHTTGADLHMLELTHRF